MSPSSSPMSPDRLFSPLTNGLNVPMLLLVALGFFGTPVLADQASEVRDGFVDFSFGENGQQVVDVVQFNSASDLAISGNGTIFLAGQATPEEENDSPMIFSVRRAWSAGLGADFSPIG